MGIRCSFRHFDLSFILKRLFAAAKINLEGG